jgi:hypothetical protein
MPHTPNPCPDSDESDESDEELLAQGLDPECYRMAGMVLGDASDGAFWAYYEELLESALAKDEA